VQVPDPVLISLKTVGAAVAQLEQGSQPVVIVVPGTGADALTSTTLAVAGDLDQHLGTPANIGVIEYPSTIPNLFKRFTGISQAGDAVLDATLRKLGADHVNKPVYLLSESQGSWLAADVLRTDPQAVSTVTRAVMYSKPGFAKLPIPPAGSAQDDGLADKLVQITHDDDMIPGLFNRISLARIEGLRHIANSFVHGHGFEYTPHHYIADADLATQFLLNGQRPAQPQHMSTIHPPEHPGQGEQPIPADPPAS
jgi:hypothetical protein